MFHIRPGEPDILKPMIPLEAQGIFCRDNYRLWPEVDWLSDARQFLFDAPDGPNAKAALYAIDRTSRDDPSIGGKLPVEVDGDG